MSVEPDIVWPFLCASFQWHVSKAHPGCSLGQDFPPFCSQIMSPRVDAAHFVYFGNDLGCLPLLAAVNNGAVNIQIQGFACTPVLHDCGCMPRSGIARSYADSIFKLLKNCQTCFYSVPLFVLHTTTKVTSLKIITDYVTTPLKTFQWLPISLRINFKLIIVACICNMAPALSPIDSFSLSPGYGTLSASASGPLHLLSLWLEARPPAPSMFDLLSACRPHLKYHLLKEVFTNHLI